MRDDSVENQRGQADLTRVGAARKSSAQCRLCM